MENPMTRRKFLEKSALVGGAGVIAAAGVQAAAKEAKAADIKPALYSVTFGGVWYQGPGFGLDDVLKKATQYGFPAIEIDGKRPGGYALDWPTPRCVEFRKKAADNGLVIAAVAANNDFSSPIAEHRESQMAYLKVSSSA